MIVPLPLDVTFARFADVPLRSSVPSCTSTDAPAGNPPPAGDQQPPKNEGKGDDFVDAEVVDDK